MAKQLLKERFQELAGIQPIKEFGSSNPNRDYEPQMQDKKLTPTFIIQNKSEEIGESISKALKQIPNQTWAELEGILNNFPTITEEPKTSSFQRGRTGWDENLKNITEWFNKLNNDIK